MDFWIRMTDKYMDTIATDKKDKKNDWNWKDLFSFIIITAVIVLPIRFFIAQPFIVSGSSMSPTFETGQYLIVDQVSYRFSEPERGDVIVFKYPANVDKYFIKRIIGLPGETVKVVGQDVFINKNDGSEEFKLDESYITLNNVSYVERTLSDTDYFVMGDNRSASLDSRVWGPLHQDFIIGKAFLRLLPFNKIDFLPGDFN